MGKDRSKHRILERSRDMRKLIAAVVMVTALLLLLAGCGETQQTDEPTGHSEDSANAQQTDEQTEHSEDSANTQQAKEYMDVADTTYSSVKAEVDSLMTALDTVVSKCSTDTITITDGEITFFVSTTELAGVIQQADQVVGKLQAAKAEYQKITSLTDVEDYAGYANAMIRVIDSNLATIEAGKGILNILMSEAQSSESGAGFNIKIGQEIEDDWNNVEKLKNDAKTAYTNAQGIKPSP